MKYRVFALSILLSFLVSAGCTVYSAGSPPGAPPPGPPVVTMGEPEFLYFMPDWGVYFVPGVSFEVFFYDGLWYYNARGAWYWGRSYRGPWSFMKMDRVPKVFRKLPPDYRTRYRNDYNRVPYGHWKKRWNEPPPATNYKQPPFLYKVPKSGAYAYPGVPDEVLRYKDRWYKRYRGLWYWSWNYNGPWAFMDAERVPKNVRKLPPQHYERDGDRYKKIPWKEQ
jgi:hypothetical protein